MLKPKKNFLITAFFTVYINRIIRRHFHKVVFNEPGFDTNKSILLIANHLSWWDGFLLYHVNRLYFKKKFHAMVLEETMREVSFFKYLGGFSVARNSREIIESLDYAAELLADTGNLVVIFPQGKLYSNFVENISFEKGAVHIAAKAKSVFQYVLAATFIENFENKKPTANIYLEVLGVEDINSNDLPVYYQNHYQASKKQQTSIVV